MRVWTRVLPLAKQRLNRLSYPRLRTYRNYITPDVCNWDWFGLKFENVYSDTFENMSYRTYLRYKATLRTPIALKIQTPIGFNSAKYDLNLIKTKLAKHLGLNEEEYCFTIMKNNTYACISTDHLKFLNVSHFLALGTSYAKFLKAYQVEESKGPWWDGGWKRNSNRRSGIKTSKCISGWITWTSMKGGTLNMLEMTV